MFVHTTLPRNRLALSIFLWLTLPATFSVQAQDRLPYMPGYDRYQQISKELSSSVKFGAVGGTWQEGGRAFDFQRDGKSFRFDVGTRQVSALPAPVAPKAAPTPATRRPSRIPPASHGEHPDRGRQYTNAFSPDGQWRAFYQNHNLWLCATNTTNAIALTTEGNADSRIKCGSANWVYGEELYQTTAIWWSPDNARVAFYRFDESQVRDYYLTYDETQVQNRLDVEPYMKVGAPNPIVDLCIYDLASKKTTRMDVRQGQPFGNQVVGHYVYGVSWTRDGRELVFHRTNRRQNILEIAAADPESGQCRVIVREEWPASWVENLPTMHFLKDGKRFIFASERTGWRNFYLYDLNGTLLAPLTAHACEVAEIVRVDEDAGLLYYMAHSGDNPMKLQLHRVGLDGRGERRLTDPAFFHSVDLAPDGQHFVDVAQTHDQPPFTTVRDGEGRLLGELGRSDASKFRKLGLRPVELLQFKAADGVTDLYGLLHFPSHFRRDRKYPLLVSVYAGPATTGASERFTLPSSLTEYGFLVASFDSRSASGRGKRFLDAIYQKLGTVEIDDQAAGVRSLWKRPYLDRRRVGIFGTSYGGTAAAACLLRYPNVFQAASANSAVTDFRNYDSIYTERYMWIPEENAAGYQAGSLMTHATNLYGHLLLYYGTADNNVHPANALQLAQALQKAGKHFEMQVGPDQGHTAVGRDRMMEFFIENLVQRPPLPWPPRRATPKSKSPAHP